jgi:LmbE family N-acetylglucosaminyl deacetylase
MAELVTEVPRRALAVYAHPDDADVASGGTLACWSSAGCDVHLVVCTDGGLGTMDPSVEPAALARTRAGELAEAASLLGLASYEVLGWRDGELDDSTGLRAEMVRLIRRIRPDVVCGHDPTAVFFGQDYFNHRDHRQAGWALLDALSPASMLPHYFPDEGPPHRVAVAYLSGTLDPDVWVDISNAVDTKAAAVQCHRSQFVDGGSWAGEAVRRRAEEEGRRAGVRFAEGFRRLRLGG